MAESADLPLLIPLTHTRIHKIKAQLLRRHGEGIHLIRRARRQRPRVRLILRQPSVPIQQRHTLRMAVHQMAARTVPPAQLVGTPDPHSAHPHSPSRQVELHAQLRVRLRVFVHLARVARVHAWHAYLITHHRRLLATKNLFLYCRISITGTYVSFLSISTTFPFRILSTTVSTWSTGRCRNRQIPAVCSRLHTPEFKKS